MEYKTRGWMAEAGKIFRKIMLVMLTILNA